jgi:hypothetical protein
MPPGSQISSRDQYAPILRSDKLHQFGGRGKGGNGEQRVQRAQRVYLTPLEPAVSCYLLRPLDLKRQHVLSAAFVKQILDGLRAK